MSVNLNRIQNKLRKTVSEISDSQSGTTINFNAIQGIASRADNVLLKSIDASRQSIESSPTLQNVDMQIKKLTTLMPESIFPEVENYFKSSIEDLEITKSFLTARQNISNDIQSDINSLSTENRDNPEVLTSILSKISENEIKGILTSDQSKTFQNLADARLKMIDQNADAMDFNNVIQALSETKSGDIKAQTKIIGDHFARTKDTGSRTVLISFADKINASAVAGRSAQDKIDIATLTGKQDNFLNQIRPIYNELIKDDAFYDLKKRDKNSILNTVVSKPSFDSFGSSSPNRIADYNILGVANNLITDLVDMAQMDNFTTDDIKSFMTEHADKIVNISHKDNRHYVKRLGDLLLENNKPDKDKIFGAETNPKITMQNSIQKRMDMLNIIYNQGAELYPNQFSNQNNQPVFGTGEPPQTNKSNVGIFNRNINPEPKASDNLIIPEDFDSNNLSMFLQLADNYSNAEPNPNANLGPYDPNNPMPMQKRPNSLIPSDFNVDMMGDAVVDEMPDFGEDYDPFDPVPYNTDNMRQYADHLGVPGNGVGKINRYIAGTLDDDLQKIKTMREVVKEYQNRGDMFNTKRAAKELALFENKIRQMLGKFIHPDSGVIKFESRYQAQPTYSYGQSFDEQELNSLLKSFSTVNK